MVPSHLPLGAFRIPSRTFKKKSFKLTKVNILVSSQPYLNGGWRALFAGGRGGECGGGLNKGGGHLRRHRGGGACRAPARWHVAHEPHAPVHFDVHVALGSHVEDLEAVVVETRELALIGPLPVISANGDRGLGVEDCQLPAWRRWSEASVNTNVMESS